MNSRVIPWPCPHCKRQHSLCYLKVRSAGAVKRVLGVNCDDSARLGQTKFVRIQQSVIDVSDLSESDLAGIPEYETAAAKAVSADKGNLQFGLMWSKPGEQHARNVDLPRAVDANSIAEDDKKATLILAEIEQVKQAKAEVQAQLNSGMATMARLDSQERDLRKELRKFWTAPLDFEEKSDLSRVQTGRLFDNTEDVPCP